MLAQISTCVRGLHTLASQQAGRITPCLELACEPSAAQSTSAVLRCLFLDADAALHADYCKHITFWDKRAQEQVMTPACCIACCTPKQLCISPHVLTACLSAASTTCITERCTMVSMITGPQCLHGQCQQPCTGDQAQSCQQRRPRLYVPHAGATAGIQPGGCAEG